MRTVDADALIEGYKHMGYDPKEHPEESYMEGWCKGFNAAVDHCIHHAIHAPTVSTEPQWIPCSVKYPKENGYYLVTIRGYIDDGLEVAVEYYSPYYSKYLKKWKAMNVIAWAVPKPYKGE